LEYRTVTEPFQLPFSSREERIAYNEDWSRSLNERLAEWTRGQDAMPGFRCECWQEDCAERIPLSGADWKMIRAKPNRFAVAPHHVADDFETVVKEFPNFWLLEKFGEAGRVAEELASSD
jgi:hypothetical protein